MHNHPVGMTCALLAALAWAFALVLFKRSGEQIVPLALNLFKNVVGTILLAATLVILRQGLAALHGQPAEDIAILAFSGIIGIALADTLFFYGLNRVGVGLVSIADCTYSPFIILFSFLLLGEQLLLSHYVGAGLILFGVATASGHKPPPGRTRGQIAVGMLLAAAGMGSMAFGIVIAKPALERTPLIWATLIRLLAGTAVLAIVTAVSRDRKALWSVFRPSAAWKYSLPAAVLGMYLALLLWIAGFKYTWASMAGILNQTSVIFAIILASLILKEGFTRRKLIAVVAALAGVLLVTLKPLDRQPPPLPVDASTLYDSACPLHQLVDAATGSDVRADRLGVWIDALDVPASRRDVELGVLQQVALAYHHHRRALEQQRVLGRLVMALGDAEHGHTPMLSQIEVRRADGVAYVLDHQQIEPIEGYLVQPPLHVYGAQVTAAFGE
jgi:drug/metabolite transporter (DMT)-like permease